MGAERHSTGAVELHDCRNQLPTPLPFNRETQEGTSLLAELPVPTQQPLVIRFLAYQSSLGILILMFYVISEIRLSSLKSTDLSEI